MANTIVIFGASGDLTSRKLIPALYRLYCKNRLPPDTIIVGVARSDYNSATWRQMLARSTARLIGETIAPSQWEKFSRAIHYQPGDISQSDDFDRLSTFLDQLETTPNNTRIYYLSTSPNLYADAVAQLGASGLADEARGSRRIVIEKPFGTDLTSAQVLNQSIHEVFSEPQVYRIDHYLGKETVQNMLVLRFANSIFEPVWNRNYVDHVQITVAEEVTVGSRAGYYDQAGVLRDMFQNHLLQLLMITAMEAPVRFQADLVRDEKIKVLQSVRPMAGVDFSRDTIRGQYESYLQEADIPGGSQTATFAVLKLCIDNWRWHDVPFYLRSGKAMSCRTTQIVIQFRQPPHSLFGGDVKRVHDANRLVIQVQPAEGIQLHFQTKVPDAGMYLRMTDLDFSYEREFSGSMPDAYQRLLLDVINGDASLFARSDEVEYAWGIIDPIIKAWQSSASPPLEIYPMQQWGPEKSIEWMRNQDREWFDVCPVLH